MDYFKKEKTSIIKIAKNLLKIKKVTQKQIKAFQYLFGKSSNVRGTQELGNRKLRLF